MIWLMGLLIVTSGCAAMMAAKQPPITDLSVLYQGAPRSEVVSELGRPFTSEKDENGNLVESYTFKQGYSKGTKIVRVMFHIVADVFTFFPLGVCRYANGNGVRW